jgi:hypothetical protein
MLEKKPFEWIQSVCLDYNDLFHSEDFMRVMKIALKNPSFDVDSITKCFEKVRKGEALLENEKNNLFAFAENKSVEVSIKWLLQKLQKSALPGAKDLEQHQSFWIFLEWIFAENGFEIIRSNILEEVKFDVSKALLDTSKLLDKAQERIQAFEEWKQAYPQLAGNMEWKVIIDNKWITIETISWKILFGFSPVIGNQKFDVDRYPKGTFTKKQLEAFLTMLGGKKNSALSWCLLWTSEALDFCVKVLWLRKSKFYWSSTSHASKKSTAWGLNLSEIDVSVFSINEYNFNSAFTSQN